MRATPITPEGLTAAIVERILTGPGDRWTRVAVDGAPAARPGEFADALAEPLRARGREVLRVRAGDFLRPASHAIDNPAINPATAPPAPMYHTASVASSMSELVNTFEDRCSETTFHWSSNFPDVDVQRELS